MLVGSFLKMPGQGWVGREHPSLCETEKRKKMHRCFGEGGWVVRMTLAFLRRERGIIYQRCHGGEALSVIGRSFKRWRECWMERCLCYSLRKERSMGCRFWGGISSWDHHLGFSFHTSSEQIFLLNSDE